MTSRYLAAKLAVGFLAFGLGEIAHASAPWTGNIPNDAKDSKVWSALTERLVKDGKYYGALAASARLLVFFTDLPTKELAYKTIISLVDQGYSFPVQPYFVPGDIEPQGSEYDFINSYYLYKSVLSKEKHLDKWASQYFSLVDQENFPKYLFYQALQAYSKNDLPQAEALLKKILAKDLPDDRKPFVKKVARTLARVYFDQEEYAKSLDIYNSFLLKLNPVSPSDWLETAWNYYHLKKYPQAVGMLYNLESHSAKNELYLEKYIIRALSYRANCDLPNAETLIQSFERDFSEVITGIKKGEALAKYPVLGTLDLPETQIFRQISTSLQELRREATLLKGLPADQLKIANYLYNTEIYMLNQKRRDSVDRAQDEAASQLITLSERLRFLRFDIAREKFNPDSVFKVAPPAERKFSSNAETRRYTLRWQQFGDFWRDERAKYQGALINRCKE